MPSLQQALAMILFLCQVMDKSGLRSLTLFKDNRFAYSMPPERMTNAGTCIVSLDMPVKLKV